MPEVSFHAIKFHHRSNPLTCRVIYFAHNILIDRNSANHLYDISTRKLICEMPTFFAKVTNENNRENYSQD